MTNAFSTVLFIDDVPVGYIITQQHAEVVFTPTEFSNKACHPPQFAVTIEQGMYHFNPSINEDVEGHVIAVLEQFQAGKLISEIL